MELPDLLWLGGTAVAAVGVATTIMSVIHAGQHHRICLVEGKIAEIEKAIHTTREAMGGFASHDALGAMRLEMTAEFRGLRGDMRGQEMAIHERLNGISRQLERLVGRLGVPAEAADGR